MTLYYSIVFALLILEVRSEVFKGTYSLLDGRLHHPRPPPSLYMEKANVQISIREPSRC